MADFEEYKDISTLKIRDAIAKYGRFRVEVDQSTNDRVLVKEFGVIDLGHYRYSFTDWQLEFKKDRVDWTYFKWDSRTGRVDKDGVTNLYQYFNSVKYIFLLDSFKSMFNGTEGEVSAFNFYLNEDEKPIAAIIVPEPPRSLLDWKNRMQVAAAAANRLIRAYHDNPEACTEEQSEPAQPETAAQEPAQSETATQEPKESAIWIPETIQKKSVARVPKESEPTKESEPAAFSAPDEIKKYKELLDMGAITQEEYDTKKKQLLGL